MCMKVGVAIGGGGKVLEKAFRWK